MRETARDRSVVTPIYARFEQAPVRGTRVTVPLSFNKFYVHRIFLQRGGWLDRWIVRFALNSVAWHPVVPPVRDQALVTLGNRVLLRLFSRTIKAVPRNDLSRSSLLFPAVSRSRENATFFTRAFVRAPRLVATHHWPRGTIDVPVIDPSLSLRFPFISFWLTSLVYI